MKSSDNTSASPNDNQAVSLAILALLVDAREAGLTQRVDAPKTETILAACGLDSRTIARIVGKKASSVRAVLSRERGATKSKSKEAPDG